MSWSLFVVAFLAVVLAGSSLPHLRPQSLRTVLVVHLPSSVIQLLSAISLLG